MCWYRDGGGGNVCSVGVLLDKGWGPHENLLLFYMQLLLSLFRTSLQRISYMRESEGEQNNWRFLEAKGKREELNFWELVYISNESQNILYMLLTLKQKKIAIIHAPSLKTVLRKHDRERGIFPYFPVLFTFSHQMATTDCPPIWVYSSPIYLTTLTRDRHATELFWFQGSQQKEMQL